MSFDPGRLAALDGVRDGLVREAAQRGPSLVAWSLGAFGNATWETGSGSISEEETRVPTIARRACALLLVPDSGTAPLVPRRAAHLPTGVESLQAEFSEGDLDLLQALADERAPAALRARVHDLRWVVLRDESSADVALASYLELALAADMGRTEEAQAAADALLRAANLGIERRSSSRVESVFRELLPRVIEQAPPSSLHRFFQAAEHLRGVERIFLANLAITRAEAEMSRARCGWARTFFSHGRRSLIAFYRSDDAKTLAAMRAHVLAEEARQHLDAGQPPWVAVSFLEFALDEVRLLRGTRDQIRTLERERDELLRQSTWPDGGEHEGGRMAMALDEVLRAQEMVDPLLRWRFFGLLPIDPPPGPQGLGRGLQVLDLFLRRFAESASGRILPIEAPPPTTAAAVDEADVRAWTTTVTQWLLPILRAVRGSECIDRGLHMDGLDHLLETSAPAVSARSAHLRRGLEEAWAGESQAALEHLVPEALRLRSDPLVRGLIEASHGLRLVDAALFESSVELGATTAAVGVESDAHSARSLLVMWWTLRVVSLAAEASPAEAPLRPLI